VLVPSLFQVRRQTGVNCNNVHSLPCFTSTDDDIQYCNVLFVLLTHHTLSPRGNSIWTPALDYGYIYCTADGLPHVFSFNLCPPSVVSEARAITSQAATPRCKKGGKSCHPCHSFITSVSFTFNFVLRLFSPFHSHIYPVVHASFHRGSPRFLLFSPPLLVSVGESSSTYSPAMASINNLLFVFHIDVVLLSLFASYVALTLPRALVRLFQPSELLNGFFLRSGTAPGPPTTSHQRSGTRTRSTRTKPIRSTSTRTNQTGRTLLDLPEDGIANEWVKSNKAQRPALVIPPRGNGTRGSRSRSRNSAPSPRRGPTRVPRWTTILHPTLAYTLNFRVAPGFSFGKLLVLLTYAAIMTYACLRRCDPFADALRTGYVAMSQIPIAVALAGKTNWLSWACGVGYEKVCVSPRRGYVCSERQR
jgi:hypothetical protein